MPALRYSLHIFCVYVSKRVNEHRFKQKTRVFIREIEVDEVFHQYTGFKPKNAGGTDLALRTGWQKQPEKATAGQRIGRMLADAVIPNRATEAGPTALGQIPFLLQCPIRPDGRPPT